MKVTAGLIVLACVSCVSPGRAQQTTTQATDIRETQAPHGAIVYDDFNHKWLDPTNWAAAAPNGATSNYTEACYYSTNVLECVREIQNGKLRLAVRSYGARNSDEGTQYGESKIIFTQPFTSISADVVVRGTKSSNCAANTSESWTQAMFTGRFFNSGSGDPNDDVDGHLTVASSTADPGILNVSSFLFWQGQYFGFVTVGTVPVGVPIRASLQWIPSGHKLRAGFENLITHQYFAADVPYSMSDTTPPTGYWDGLYVQAFPVNCTAQQTSSQIEATFDNVVLNY